MGHGDGRQAVFIACLVYTSHDASRRGNDGNAEAAEHLGKLLCAGIDTQAGLGYALEAGDGLLAAVHILERDADDALRVALERLKRLDIAFVEQDLGNCLLH